MLHILATVVFVVAAVAALVSLADSSLVARAAAEELARERALVRMGFLPQVPAHDLRPRPAQPRGGHLMQASRARALPLRFAVPAAGAA